MSNLNDQHQLISQSYIEFGSQKRGHRMCGQKQLGSFLHLTNTCDSLIRPTNQQTSGSRCKRARETNMRKRPLSLDGGFLLVLALIGSYQIILANSSSSVSSKDTLNYQQRGSIPGHRLERRQADDNDHTDLAPVTTTTSTSLPINAESDQNGAPQGAKPKIQPINYTLIDELFEARLNETEVANKWKSLDKQLIEGVRAVLKMVFPHVVSMSSDAKVSGACSGAILKWILNLRNLRTWAVKMLDATGKPSAGILEGSLSMLGNYRQCLEVRAPDEDEIELVDEFREYFRGQYCVLQLRPHLPEKPAFFSLNSTLPTLMRKSYKYYEKNVYDDLSELALAFNFVHIRADLCVPSLCSRDDIQRVANFLASKADLRARVARCDVQPRHESDVSAAPSVALEKSLDNTHKGWIIAMLIFATLLFISTLIHCSIDTTKKRIEFVIPSPIGPKLSSRMSSIMSSMSLFKSWNQIKTVHLEQINDKRPIFLEAIKLGLLLWIFLVNLISQLDFQFMREMLPLRNMIMEMPMQFLVNSTLQYDALIVITAFIYAYENINCNIVDLIKYNIAKYSQLAPSIMLLVGVTIFTPLFYQYKSPVWHDFVDQQASVCRETGLYNLAFIQNYLNYNDICLPQTWIFCVQLQLSLLAIPIVYMLNRQFDTYHGKFRANSTPIAILLGVIGLGCLHNFINIYRNSLPPAWFLTYPDKQDKAVYFESHLYKTSTHLIAFATGLICGHLCRCKSVSNFSGKPYGRKSSQSVMTLTSFLLMVAIIFGTYQWSLSGRAHLDWPIASALYAGLAPLGWSVAWCLALFRLAVPAWSDKGEEAAGSLSSCLVSLGPVLVRLGRLGFLAYLINPYVNTFVYAIQEQTIFSSIIMLAHTLIGNIFFTYLLAIIVSLIVEIPVQRLIKKILLGPRRQCTNFGIIARQLDIHQREMQLHGHGHDSFSGPEVASSPIGFISTDRAANTVMNGPNSISPTQQMEKSMDR